MIDEVTTFKKYKYYSTDLTCSSHRKVWAICDYCGKGRWVRFGTYSIRCLSCAQRGRKHSDETKKKIGRKSKGRKLSEEARKKISKAGIGRKHTEESKLKMSKSSSGENGSCFGIKGKNHPNWNPNLTDKDRQDKRNYPEYKEWRSNIYKRDNYTCQICGELGNILNAHHLDGYRNNPDKRILLENGVTLCKKCHNDFHHQYGNNNTKEQFIIFKANNG